MNHSTHPDRFAQHTAFPESGKSIPEDEDLKEVEDNYPDASNAEKWRLAQACAMLRAKREYDDRIVTGVNTETTYGLD
ncbi:MAG: hypothetical protein ISR95_07130 [Candidatus Marinimicrobia bacterium]|nr:hypothetical protein [Candidatus Neomarinimicrobiota bacterium]